MNRHIANQLAISLAEMIGTAADITEIINSEIVPGVLTTDGDACLRQLRKNLVNTLDIARAFQTYTAPRSAMIV